MPEPPYILSADGVAQGEDLLPGALPPLGLDGRELTFIRIEHVTRLHFGDTEIVIETAFELAVHGVSRLLDPGERGELGPLLAIYPSALVAATIESNLTLRLTFDRGATITVPQNQHYESWHVIGPGTRLIVCPPAGNGTLSVWV